MTTLEGSNIKRNLLIIVPITVGVVLIIAFLYSQKLIPSIFRHSKGSILPMTNTPPLETSLPQHPRTLRTWWKSTLAPAPRSAPHHNQPTHQEWYQRYRAQKDRYEEEHRRDVQKEWKPRLFTQEYTQLWKEIAEKQEKARRTQWEKLKDKMGL